MNLPIAVIDYETEGIGFRPEHYPPKPVGVALLYDDQKVYAAWGHPSENNCTVNEARSVLKDLLRNYHCIFHNCIFDIEVGIKHLQLPFPSSFDDTLYMAFLHNPRDTSLSLKPLADKYLSMQPTEQEALCEWILGNVVGATKKKLGGAHCIRSR